MAIDQVMRLRFITIQVQSVHGIPSRYLNYSKNNSQHFEHAENTHYRSNVIFRKLEVFLSQVNYNGWATPQ